MKKIFLLLFCFIMLLNAAACFAEGGIFDYRFADAEETAQLLLSNRSYYDNLTQNDLNFRMQKLDATLEELEAFAAEQTLDWTADEKAAVDAAMQTIEMICEERGYTLPATDSIVFSKTTMREECDAGAYTHGTQIYISEWYLQQGISGDPAAQMLFREIVAHELFHCLTRNHPDFRADMYGILGFTVVDEDYDFSPEIDAVIISNPDVEHHNSYASFEINGEMKNCTVIFTNSAPFEKPGDNFFDNKVPGLIPVDDLSVMYTSEDAANFLEVFGKNTDYVVDPEETLADNFAFTVIYGLDMEYETPEIIEAIDAYLKSGNTADRKFSETEKTALDHLSKELEESADHLMRNGEDVDDIYSTLNWTSVADTFPEKFDLRDRGTVTPVKNQTPWGTCWSFATIAASETSILNSLGLTAEEYKEKFGEEMDLSEKHLAWFTANALPELDAYPEGEYPHDEAQAGEGLHPFEDSDLDPFNYGGNYFMSTAGLASGVGILKEKYAPYTDSEGELDSHGDWSLPEEERFTVSFELKDTNILPSPASFDENGSYVYRPAATEAIKSELMAGRAVAVSFLADLSMPEKSMEEKRAQFEANLSDNSTLTEEEKAYYISVRIGEIDTADLTTEELKDLIRMRERLNSLQEDLYDLDSFDHDQLAMILQSRYFSRPFEEIEENANVRRYMTFVGTDPVIFAQYTDEALPSNHGVTVVGWDDTFSKTNWPEGHRPPADGVWIVKNSWNTDWGNEGYFLLSYYDMTINGIGSFEYVVSKDVEDMDYLTILEHDYMPSEIISSTLFDEPVYAANIFEITEDSVLQFISAMTGDLNTTVTASVYLLDEDAVLPTDGILLDSITRTFKFAGYHRMELTGNLLLPEGSRIGVAVLERVPGNDDIQYALVNNSSLSRDGAEAFNIVHEGEDRDLKRYAKGIVNPGESFVSFEPERWIDWAETIDLINDNGANVYMAYDNLPVKAYVYPWAQVQQIHDLSHRIPVAGGEAAICPEDGYMLLDVAR